MNHEQAAKILRASVKDLSEPLKSAVEFTLATFYLPSSAELAKNFLASVPYEVFMARDLRDTNPTLKAKIDAAYFTIMNDDDVWLGLDDLPHEQWRDVVGYEGLYQVIDILPTHKCGGFRYQQPKLLMKAKSYKVSSAGRCPALFYEIQINRIIDDSFIWLKKFFAAFHPHS